MKKNLLPLILIILGVIFILSCNDSEISTDPSSKLQFSKDTVHFDTVFSTIGSTTRSFKIYNRNEKSVLTTISLSNQQNSHYRLNIDGEATNKIENYELRQNDSAFIFVEVTVNPQNSNSPIVVEDSIMFFTNGNTQVVNLVSYGQDVHLINDSVIETTTWVADKPYLIYNSALVDTNQTLTIEAGAQIHFHNQSALWVLGTLKVKGTSDEPVVFQGDRLEEYYKDKPGQWWGRYINKEKNIDYLTGCIHFWKGSTQNVIDNAIIKNGTKGIEIDSSVNDNFTLILKNSIVQNMSSNGIFAKSAKIKVINSEISNCGHYAVALSLGGSYEFYHTTIGNYYKWDTRKSASLVFNNYYFYNNMYTTFDFNAYLYNSIVYGNLENEFIIDQYVDESKQFTFKFDHCLMKLNSELNTSNEDIFTNLIKNEDPNFVNTGNKMNEISFQLDTLSAAKDFGSVELINDFPTDRLGNDRLFDGKPDIGAYERIE